MFYKLIVVYALFAIGNFVFADDTSSLDNLSATNKCSECSFSSLSLRGFIFSNSKINNSNFTDVNLSKSFFMRSNLQGSDFKNVNLKYMFRNFKLENLMQKSENNYIMGLNDNISKCKTKCFMFFCF